MNIFLIIFFCCHLINETVSDNDKNLNNQLHHIDNSKQYTLPRQPQGNVLPNVGLPNNNNFPIIGTIIGNIPNTLPGQLGVIPGPAGLSGLGNWNGNWNGLIPSLGGSGSGSGSGIGNSITSCPLTQQLRCRCEPLLPIRPLKTENVGPIKIINENIKYNNKDNSQEISISFNNGMIIHQKVNKNLLADDDETEVAQGYYSLKVKDNQYLTIFYTINDLDYTVKAEVSMEPPLPQTDLTLN